MPAWKKKALEDKARREAKESAPQREKGEAEQARKAKIDAMPAWMQKLAKK